MSETGTYKSIKVANFSRTSLIQYVGDGLELISFPIKLQNIKYSQPRELQNKTNFFGLSLNVYRSIEPNALILFLIPFRQEKREGGVSFLKMKYCLRPNKAYYLPFSL